MVERLCASRRRLTHLAPLFASGGGLAGGDSSKQRVASRGSMQHALTTSTSSTTNLMQWRIKSHTHTHIYVYLCVRVFSQHTHTHSALCFACCLIRHLFLDQWFSAPQLQWPILILLHIHNLYMVDYMSFMCGDYTCLFGFERIDWLLP